MEYMVPYLNIGNEQFQFYLQSISRIFSQSDFTAVNSGRAGRRILRRILFIIEFHRRLGLSELSEISSTKKSVLH